MNRFHTIVLHESPDIEACFMAFLVLYFESVRDALGVEDCPAIKFIPAGRLRKEYFPGVKPLTSDTVRKAGFLTMDCGGGPLDQHGHAENAVENRISSLDLLAAEVKLDKLLPHLMPAVQRISMNDLHATPIVPQTTERPSVTPHTTWDLRTLVNGLNYMFPRAPLKVLGMMRTAFAALYENVQWAAARNKLITFEEMFLVPYLMSGVTRYFDTVYGTSEHDESTIAAVQWYDSCEKAFRAWESAWAEGERDYEKATIATMPIADKSGHVMSGVVVCGQSTSPRFAAVARRGIKSRGRKNRPGASVVIQFSDEGRFVISTKGIMLYDVAAVLRMAECIKRGIDVSIDEYARFGDKGHGKSDDLGVVDLYLAEFCTAFGNGFRANMHGTKSVLSTSEVYMLVCIALGNTFRFSVEEVKEIFQPRIGVKAVSESHGVA